MIETPLRGNETWLSAASYWSPQHLILSAWMQHAPFAFWIVDAVRPSSIVELGTHLGYSYFAFCDAVVRLGLDTELAALDTWAGDDQAGFYGEDVYESVKAVNDAEYAAFSRLLRGYFDESLDKVPDGSIDLLHIDGRHSYTDVWHDFRAWLPKLSDRAVVLFHDIAEHQEDFGVWQFWDEVSGQYPSFAFEHGHGLGVLGVGSDLPAKLVEFFAAGASLPEFIRNGYAKLGERIEEQYEIQQLAESVIGLREQLAERSLQLETVQLEKQEFSGRIDSLVTELELVRNSTSWKLTAPLRAVSGLVRPHP